MTRKVNAKSVEKSYYSNYLKKAEENLRSAEYALKIGDWNSSAVSSVHGAISAADAYCIFASQKRSAGDRHEDCEALIMNTPFPGKQNREIASIYMAIIRIKNMAEYEERLVKKGDAEKAALECAKLINLIKRAVE